MSGLASSRTQKIISLARNHGENFENVSEIDLSVTQEIMPVFSESLRAVDDLGINGHPTDEILQINHGINNGHVNETECLQNQMMEDDNNLMNQNLLLDQIDNVTIIQLISSNLQEASDFSSTDVQVIVTEDCSKTEINQSNLATIDESHNFVQSKVTDEEYDENEQEVNSNEGNSDKSYIPEKDNSGSSSSDEENNNNAININPELANQNVENENVVIQKGKKRKRNVTKWEKNVRKTKRASGDEYVNASKKIIKKKKMGAPCSSVKCLKECTQKISEENRRLIHSQFWNSSHSEDQKRQFIISCIEEVPVKRIRLRNGHREGKRKTSLKYFFSVDSTRIPICRTFFLNTLCISQTAVRTALKKRQSSGIVEIDQRGRHEPVNKISPAFRNLVCDHINKFPCEESHYSRNRTQRKYLGTHLNISRMYSLFVEDCKENGIFDKDIPKYWLYAEIFNTEFNLSFSQPSNDTCDSCDEFIIKLKDTPSLEERQKIQEEYDMHLLESQKRYSRKRIDKEDSQGKSNVKVVMVDLQKCLPTPLLHNAQSFYSLKLWSFNYTVYDATSKKSSCFMWDESLAGRGGNEMASCILRYIIGLDNSVEHIIVWSDNCPSQNRNMHMIVAYFYAFILKPSIKIIEHKYLLRGHTHLEVDTVHARLEKELKKTPDFSIITPWDWQQLARICGSKSNVEVKPMELEDFKNFSVMYDNARSPLLQNKKTVKKENFLISKIISMQFRKESPGILYFKCDLDKDFEEVDFNRKTYKRPWPTLEPLRSSLRPITKKKYSDLQKLLKWVPKRFHEFYKGLSYEETSTADDPE